MKKLLSLLNQRHLRLVLSLLLLMSAFVAVRPLQADAQSPSVVTCNSSNAGQKLCWQDVSYECKNQVNGPISGGGYAWTNIGPCSCNSNNQCEFNKPCINGSCGCKVESNCNQYDGAVDFKCDAGTCRMKTCAELNGSCIAPEQCPYNQLPTTQCGEQAFYKVCCAGSGGGNPGPGDPGPVNPKPGDPTPPPPAESCTVAANLVLNGKLFPAKGVIRAEAGQPITLRANTKNVNGGKVSGVKFAVSQPSYITPAIVPVDTTVPYQQTFTTNVVEKGSRTTVRALVRFQGKGNTNICSTSATITVVPKICNLTCKTANPYSCGVDGKYKCLKVAANEFRCRDPKYPKSSTCSPATATPTPTPTPTPPTEKCEQCQYQIDAFWGPVIESFKGGQRYSMGITDQNYQRLFNAAHDKGASPANVKCALAPVQEKKVAITLPSIGCELPIKSGKLKASPIDRSLTTKGVATTTFTNTTSNCTYEVGLASYKANWKDNLTYMTNADIEDQNLFDHEVVSIGPKETVTLSVKMPINGVNESNIDTSACYGPIDR